MSFFSWLKNLFIEDVSHAEEAQEEGLRQELRDIDYKLKIFDLRHRSEVSEINSFIVQDKAIALIKMNKFTGDHATLKEVLNELKYTCGTCNSKLLGLTNNIFLVLKDSIEVLKE